MTNKFILPVEAENQLTEIFTPKYMHAVKAACRRYLHDTAEKKPGMAEEGPILIEIAEKARDLRQLLKKNNSALERVQLHLSENHNIHDIFSEIIDLQEKLRILENRCLINPAVEWVNNKRQGQGREPGSANTAGRAFAFHLWDIYKQAHGKPAKRGYDNVNNIEAGPLPRAMNILKPILRLEYNFVRYFREIGEQFNKNNGQKIKKRKKT